jgi:hypothetical protein
MASTMQHTAPPVPANGVIVSLTGSRSGDDWQVPRRGTCKGVRAGSVGGGRRWGIRGGRGPGGVGRPGRGSWLGAEAASDGGGGGAGGGRGGRYTGGVEELVGVECPVGGGEGEPGATSVRTPSSSPGSQWAIPKPTRRSMVRQVRPLRASDGPMPRDWPSSRRSTRAGSRSRHRTGGRRRASSADGPMTPAQTCSTKGSSSANPTRRTLGLGWGTAWMASTSGGSMHH